jgi:hypothetical protein
VIWNVKAVQDVEVGQLVLDGTGEVSERLIEPVSKTGVLFIEYRGFESRPLR